MIIRTGILIVKGDEYIIGMFLQYSHFLFEVTPNRNWTYYMSMTMTFLVDKRQLTREIKMTVTVDQMYLENLDEYIYDENLVVSRRCPTVILSTL